MDPHPLRIRFVTMMLNSASTGRCFRPASLQRRALSQSRPNATPKTARKYLGWFSDLGIVTCHDGHPSTYERNDAYFQWRRINQLAAEYTIDELQEHVRTLTTRITDYEDTYDATTPAAVDAVDAAETSDERTIDDVYSDLADWATARDERKRYERARQQRAGAETDQASG